MGTNTLAQCPFAPGKESDELRVAGTMYCHQPYLQTEGGRRVQSGPPTWKPAPGPDMERGTLYTPLGAIFDLLFDKKRSRGMQCN